MNTEERQQNEALLRRDSIQKQFGCYYFDETKSASHSKKITIIEEPTVSLLK